MFTTPSVAHTQTLKTIFVVVVLQAIFALPAIAAAPAGPASASDLLFSPLVMFSSAPLLPATPTAHHMQITEDVAWNRTRAPHYPAIAVAEHAQGTVYLRVYVGSAGRPLAILPIFRKGAPLLSESLVAAAVHAVARFRFHVPIRDGKPSEGWVDVPFAFKLHQPPWVPSPSSPSPPPSPN